MTKLLVPVREAAAMVGVSRSTAYELVRAGEWPSTLIGGKRVVPVRFIEQLAERVMRTTSETAPPPASLRIVEA